MNVRTEALVRTGRLDLLVAKRASTAGIGERRYLTDAIERATLLADPGALRGEIVSALSTLGIEHAAPKAPVLENAVILPFVAEGGLGFGRLVYVSPTADHRDAAVKVALRAAAKVREPAADLDRYGLAFAQPRAVDGLSIEGRSLGAATFASAVALFSGRRVQPGTLVSGELIGDQIGSVGGLAKKIEGCLASRGDVRRVVVPSRNLASVRALVPPDVELLGVANAAALLEAVLAPGIAAHRDPEAAVDQARRVFRSGWDGYRWATQREPLERLEVELPSYRPDLLVEVMTMRGALTRHLGAPDESARILADAEQIVASPEGDAAVPDLVRTLLAQHQALTFSKLCRFEEASRAAKEAIALAARGRLRGELLKAHGCAGLVALSRGRAASAVRHQEEALALSLSHRPSAAPRTSGYLVEALGRAGRLDEAQARYKEAQRWLSRGPERGRASRDTWLRVAWAGALIEAERHRDARRVLDREAIHAAIEHAPLPGLLARRHLGVALAHARDPSRGFALLAESPVVYGRGTLPHVRFLAQLNVLEEARLRAERDALDGDARARAATALTHLPRYGETPAFLEAARRRVTRALEGPDQARAARALGKLLDRARRLA